MPQRPLIVGPLFPAIVSALLGVVLYGVTLGGSWVYDDTEIAYNDPRLYAPGQWKHFLDQGYFDHGIDNLWRPLPSLSFAAQWHIASGPAWTFHLVNILLHAAVCAAVAILAWQLAQARGAWIAGLLFAVHPVHVEGVAYLVGRCETMAALGMLGALVLLVGASSKPMSYARAVGIYAFFLLAILSKEQGLFLAPMMLAWGAAHWWQKRGCCSPLPSPSPLLTAANANDASRSVLAYEAKGSFKPLWPLSPRGPRLLLILLITWSLAIYIVYRQHILPWTWDIHSIDWWLNPLVRSTGADRWLIPVAILGRYAALLIFPWRLSPDYSASVFMPHLQWSSPYFYLGIATLLAYGTACVIAFMRRSAPALFALACLGMSYFLVGNFVLIGTIFGERLIYLPSAFFLILLAMAMRQLPPRWLAGLMAVALLLASLRTVTYAARWNDPMRFFQQSLQEQPDNVQLGMVYAMKLYHLGDLAGAQQAINQACQHTPDCWKAWYLSAMVALDRGDRPQALRCYEKADQLDGAKTAFFGLKSRLYAPATQPH